MKTSKVAEDSWKILVIEGYVFFFFKLRGMDTLGTLSAISTKGHSFNDFLFVFMYIQCSLLLKEKNCSWILRSRSFFLEQNFIDKKGINIFDRVASFASVSIAQIKKYTWINFMYTWLGF